MSSVQPFSPGPLGTFTAGALAANRLAFTGFGTTLRVYNAGANTLNVYPPTSAQINALGLNVADTIAAGACKTYVGLSSALYRIKT